MTSDSWTCSELQADDSVTLLRVREIEKLLKLDNRIRIIWEYGSPGLPSESDLPGLEKCESIFNVGFEERSSSLMTHVITGDGIRQWVFYAESVESFMNTLNADLPHSPPFPIQLEYEEDASWQEYLEMRSLVE